MVDQNRAENALGFGQDMLQGFFDVLFGVGKRDYADSGTLPDVVKVQLGDRDIELVAQPVLQAAEDLTLVLEGAGVRDVQLQRQ